MKLRPPHYPQRYAMRGYGSDRPKSPPPPERWRRSSTDAGRNSGRLVPAPPDHPPPESFRTPFVSDSFTQACRAAEDNANKTDTLASLVGDVAITMGSQIEEVKDMLGAIPDALHNVVADLASGLSNSAAPSGNNVVAIKQNGMAKTSIKRALCAVEEASEASFQIGKIARGAADAFDYQSAKLNRTAEELEKMLEQL